MYAIQNQYMVYIKIIQKQALTDKKGRWGILGVGVCPTTSCELTHILELRHPILIYIELILLLGMGL